MNTQIFGLHTIAEYFQLALQDDNIEMFLVQSIDVYPVGIFVLFLGNVVLHFSLRTYKVFCNHVFGYAFLFTSINSGCMFNFVGYP